MVLGVREMSLNPGVRAMSCSQVAYCKQENQTGIVQTVGDDAYKMEAVLVSSSGITKGPI